MLPCSESSYPCFLVQRAVVRASLCSGQVVRASLYRGQLSVLPCTEDRIAGHAGVWGPAWHGQSSKAIQAGTKSAVMSPCSEDGALSVALQAWWSDGRQCWAVRMVLQRRLITDMASLKQTCQFVCSSLLPDHDPSLAFRHPSLKLCRSSLRC